LLDCIADARRSVFLHCWKAERSKKFVPLLAKGIVAYDATYQSPFDNENDELRDSSHIFSRQDFSNDVKRRREVAKCIVEDTTLPIDAVYGCWMQLLRAEDGEFVVTSLGATVSVSSTTASRQISPITIQLLQSIIHPQSSASAQVLPCAMVPIGMKVRNTARFGDIMFWA
jgi:hypothetical protein